MRGLLKDKKEKKERTDPTWKLTYKSFKPQQEGLREALCTLGNGYFGTRGAICEAAASQTHYPGTYINGIYNKLGTKIAGKIIKNEDFVNCPNWLCLSFKIGKSAWINPAAAEKIHSWHQELNFKTGILKRKVSFSTANNKKTTVTEERLVDMSNCHRAAIRYTIKPENYSGKITVRAGLDGSVENTGVSRYRQLNSKHLKSISGYSFGHNSFYLSAKTSQSKISIFEAARVDIYSGRGNKIKPCRKKIKKEKNAIYQEIEINCQKKKAYQVEKIVAIYTSKDKEVSNPLFSAKGLVKKAYRFESIANCHKKAWNSLWKKFDIKVEGNKFTQKILRFHAFCLLQVASPNTVALDAGLPARGLHGEAYRGHVFWDEIFTTPFYDAHLPAITQSLILYRYRRLIPAKKAAKQAGLKGAMFPWQSSLTGEEETQIIHLNPLSGKWGPDYSCRQRHISFAIAYNIWRHWERTRDVDFMSQYGAEMLAAISQFAASLVKFDKQDKRYHTQGLMGPDEFHEKFPGAKKPGFRDNAYTNILIVWTLIKAQRALKVIPKPQALRVMKKLKITKKDLKLWQDITKKMNLVINKAGIISQFDGYFKLKELNWQHYRNKYKNIKRMDRILKAEGKSPDEYKVSKQADVLMTFYLIPFFEVQEIFADLGYKMNRDVLKKNYDYYIKRTSHGSTLSVVVHCYLANFLGKKEEGWQWFQRVLESDIYDAQGGTTPEGIHAGVMGGSIEMVTRGFCGVRPLEDRIRINSRPPRQLSSISYNFYYQGYRVFINLKNKKIEIYVKSKKTKKIPVTIEAFGKVHYLMPQKTYLLKMAA